MSKNKFMKLIMICLLSEDYFHIEMLAYLMQHNNTELSQKAIDMYVKEILDKALTLEENEL